MKKLAILTSGGDAPGMNAAIRAATMLGIASGAEVMGVEHGYRGLIDGQFRSLDLADVSGIIRDGGTMLGSTRCPEFHEQDARGIARKRLADEGVDSIVVIGGNGSLAGARLLAHPNELGEQVLNLAGIPASIDNDVGLTGLSIGVDTAINTIVEACDRISDTASAHDRCFIVEVMGRQCGYLAMTAAVASAADAVLFPEAHKTDDEVVEFVTQNILTAQKRTERSKRVLIIKAEGVHIGTEELKLKVDERLKKHFNTDTPPVETRVTVLGHVVRGGRPTAQDRLLGSRLAHVATQALMDGITQNMAAWIMPEAGESDKFSASTADPYCRLVPLDAVIAGTNALLSGNSPVARWRANLFSKLEDVLSL